MTARTAVAAVFGDPIEHSLSPIIHNAAFNAMGLDWVFVAHRVGAGHAADAVAAMRSLGLRGASVTMPLKHEIAGLVDELTPMASRLAAVNCLFWRDDTLVGDNTDGAGAVWAVERHLGVSIAGARVVVCGAGGAARAVISAVAEAGAAEVVVVNRSTDRANSAASLAGGVGRVAGLDELAGGDFAGAFDIAINATSLGMIDGPKGVPLDLTHGCPGTVMDLIYHPLETEWLLAARTAGARVANGVPMLVGQAAVAFERWTGQSAPVESMLGAVHSELAS